MKMIAGGIVGIIAACVVAITLPPLPELIYPIIGAVGCCGGIFLVYEWEFRH